MKKKIFCTALAFYLCFIFSGCWNYTGLDSIDLVSGMAVDKDMETGIYFLTFEIIDTHSSGRNMEPKTKYVEAHGETIFSALRNSKKRLINKLYGGNMQTLIISRQIAATDGVDKILEELLRDGEPRETLSVVISQEETAKEILLVDGLDSNIISYDIHDMILEDNRITSSTKQITLYKAYDAIKGTGSSLVLPVVRLVKNIDKPVVESNGIALFDNDRLIKFDTPQNATLYLFIEDEIKGGTITLPVSDPDESISLEIKFSNTKTQAYIKDDKLHIDIKIKIKLNVMEIKSQLEVDKLAQRKELENLTSQILEQRIRDYIEYIQTEVAVDIFGFGKEIYHKDPDLWRSIEQDWNSWFQKAEANVEVSADLVTFGVLKDY